MKPKSVKSPPKKGKKGRKSQKASVKNTLVKAKVSAVKTGRKLRNPRGKRDEIEDLLERTANDSTLNGSYNDGSSNGKGSDLKVAAISNKIKKMRSYISGNLSNGSGSSNGTPKANGSANGSPSSNGHFKSSKEWRTSDPKRGLDDSIEQAEEAMETEVPGKRGFLQKTMSRIWKMPLDGMTGVPYNEVGAETSRSPPKDTVNTESESSKCVIC